MQERDSRLILTCLSIFMWALGCRVVGGDEAFILLAQGDSKQLRFDSETLRSRCPGGVLIVDLGVSEDGCQEDCSQWWVVRRGEISPSTPRTPLPIEYGQAISELEIRVPPKELAPGEYLVSGTVACYEGGEVMGHIASGRFLIAEDGAAGSAR